MTQPNVGEVVRQAAVESNRTTSATSGAPEDRCTLTEGCDRPFETTTVGWAGGSGWVFDACWPCAKRSVDAMSGWAA